MNTTIILLGAAAAGLVALVFAARKWGKAAGEAARLKASHEKSREAREIDDDVARLDRDALDRELRDR